MTHDSGSRAAPSETASHRAAPNTASHDLPVSADLAAFMRTGWADGATTDTAGSDTGVATASGARYAAKRRADLSALFPGEALVVPAGEARARNNDVDYPFRPGSDFVWTTGASARIAEPGAVLVLLPEGDGHREVLFARPRVSRATGDEFYRDRRYGELWVGRRPDLDETEAALGVRCRPLAELPSALAVLPDARLVRGLDAGVDAQLPTSGPSRESRDAEFAAALAELRLVKDDWEIDQLRDAAAATARGFTEVVRELHNAVATSERWVEGTFWRRARVDGNDVGYGTIAAAGEHACVLHWTRDDGPVRPGDLLLLDAGVENRYFYTADVTRTLPVDGHFTAVQRRVYDLVYRAQQAGIDAVRPGARFADYHEAAMATITEGLIDWGILPASAAGSDLHRRYTLHRSGHMLGLDVHDCASARADAYPGGSLRPGHVLTVEPGLYFQPDDLTVPGELRGIGVRIEDDVLVTADGNEVLSSALPGRADDVETWMGRLLGRA